MASVVMPYLADLFCMYAVYVESDAVGVCHIFDYSGVPDVLRSIAGYDVCSSYRAMRDIRLYRACCSRNIFTLLHYIISCTTSRLRLSRGGIIVRRKRCLLLRLSRRRCLSSGLPSSRLPSVRLCGSSGLCRSAGCRILKQTFV